MANRTPQKRGVKEYLVSMEVGETRRDDGSLNWASVRRIAHMLKDDYGCEYVFRTSHRFNYRQVTRVK